MPDQFKDIERAADSKTGNGKLPLVWLLLDDRPGHATQVVGLARQIKWPLVALHLEFNFLNWLPNPVLGGTLLGLSGQSKEKLRPPFPDLVIGMGRRVVPIARWIKRQSRGHARIVLLGRKALGNAADIDLFVSCIHFRQLPREGLFELLVPPTQVDASSLAAARRIQPNPIATTRKPRVVLLVGGSTAQHRFDVHFARRMVEQIALATHDLSGSLAIVTSRRTPREAVEAMRSAASTAHIHVWQKERPDNPYLSYLANADLLVVTGESESMIAEASATGQPLTIYPLEARSPGLKHRLANALVHAAGRNGMIGRMCGRILRSGWIAPVRDLNLMHHAMQERGMAQLFDGSLNTTMPRRSNEFELLADRLVKLVSGWS